MPQIPIVSGSQRIEPGTPVAAIGVEDSRMTGNQIAALGKEVFNIGNALDAVARRAKDNEDKLRVNSAIGRARLEMLKEKAKQDAESIQFGDSADGVDGIDRYNERINPLLSNIQEGLETPEQKKLFEAGIADDIVTYSTQVLASEVSKREKVVPILMEDNLRQRASFVRNSGSMADMLKNVDLMAAEQEAEILGNTMIPDARKPEEILRTKKQLVLEGTQGLLEQGEAGNTNAWGDARQFMVEKSGQLLTAQEKDKLMGDINSAEYSWYTRERSNDEYRVRLQERAAKESVRNKSATYTNLLAQAGNSDVKRAPILRQIELDADLDFDPNVKRRLIENRTFMEVQDDAYQLKAMDKVLRTKNYTAMLDQLQADQGNTVSIDRATKLQAAIRGLQEHQQKNPYITQLLSQAKDELNNYKKPATFDVVSGMYKQENDTYNEKAQTDLMLWAARTASSGQLSPGAIESKLGSIIKQYYGGRTVTKPVQGVSPDKLSTSTGIRETTETLFRDMRAGKYNTPEKKKELSEKLRGLKTNQDAVKTKEEAAVKTQNTGSSKIFDE